MIFETIIGLEIHIELNTRSKMFYACSDRVRGTAKCQSTCPQHAWACPALIRSLTRRLYRLALRAARALNCRINKGK